MTTKELKTKIEKMIANEEYISLRNFLYSNFDVYYFNGENYAQTKNAASYNRNNTCTNSYLKCDDGFVADPF